MRVPKVIVLTAATILVLVLSFWAPLPRMPGKQYEVTILNDKVALIEGNRFEYESVRYELSREPEWVKFCGRDRRVCLEMPTSKIERGHKFTAEMWVVPTPIKLPE